MFCAKKRGALRARLDWLFFGISARELGYVIKHIRTKILPGDFSVCGSINGHCQFRRSSRRFTAQQFRDRLLCAARGLG